MAEDKSSSENQVQEWKLGSECELRFEVDQDKNVSVTLKEGNAEVFGIEMARNQEYTFTAAKIAIFTWYGAELQTRGPTAVAYTSNETPMATYVNTHAQLEARRDVAANANLAAEAKKEPQSNVGPKVMVVGPTDSGKSSLTKLLLAYAVRLGKAPTFVDIDVGQGEITIPGTVAAGAVNQNLLSIEDGLSLTAPLVFFYGHNNLGENPNLYKHLVTRLGECINMRFENDPEAAASGCVVNTAGWVEGLGYELLLHCAEALGIDTVLVMGQDRLYAEMRRDLPERINVIKLPRSGGVVNRDTKFRRSARKSRVKEYFYGTERPGGALSPAMVEYNFSKLNIYRVGGDELSEAMLPVGQKSTLDPLQITKVSLAQELVHSVLAVCHPVVMADGTVLFSEEELKESTDSQIIARELVSTNIAGFLYVTEVDLEKQKVSFLSPCSGALPSYFLLMGSLKWMEY